MNRAAELLAEHGPTLLVGATILLALGMAAMLLARWPVHRQRIGEATLLGTLVWLTLACVPLPRLSLGDWWSPSAGGDLPSDVMEADGSPSPLTGVSVWDQAGNSFDIETPSIGDAELADVEFTPSRSPALLEAESATTGNESGNERDSESRMDPPLTSTPPPAPPDFATGTPVDDILETPGTADAGLVPEVASPLQATSLVPYFYLAGAVAAVCWLMFGQLLLTRTLRRCGPADDRTQRIYDALPCAPCRRRPRLLVSGTLARPISCGVLQPTIVLPDYRRRGESPTWLRHVLLHELGHCRQRDAWSHGLFNLALPVLYFHPLYWRLRGSVELSRELLADDWAARHTSPVQYADEMIALARRGGFGRAQLSVVGVFSSPSQFYRRMSMLVQRKEPLHTRCSPRWRAAAVLICAAVIITSAGLSGVRWTAAEETEQPAEDAAGVIEKPADNAEWVSLVDNSQSPPDKLDKKQQAVSQQAIISAVQNELAATEKKLDALNRRYETLMLATETAESETVQHEIRIIHDTIANLRREQLDLHRAARDIESQILTTEADIKKIDLPQEIETVVLFEMRLDPRYIDLSYRSIDLQMRKMEAESRYKDNPAVSGFKSTMDRLEEEEQQLKDELRPMVIQMEQKTKRQFKIDVQVYKKQLEEIRDQLTKNQEAITAEQRKLKELGVVSADLERVMRDINDQSAIAAGHRKRLAELSAAIKTREIIRPLVTADLPDADAKQAASLAELKKAKQLQASQEEAQAAQLATLKAENALLKAKLSNLAQTDQPDEKPATPPADKPKQAAGAKAGPESAPSVSAKTRTPLLPAGSAAAAQLTGTGSALDLIGLANSYAEAIAEQQIAQVEIERAHQEAEKNGDRAGVKVAEIRYVAARNKARLMRGIVEALLEAANKEHAARMEHVERLENLGAAISTADKRAAEQSAAQGRVNIQILQLILDTD